MKKNILLGVLTLVCITYSLEFAGIPTVSDLGNEVRIQFSVAETCDVAVFVENEAGKVVRHIAAGRLGRKAPSPLQTNSLSQTLLWDKLDDNGNAINGEFKVKIGLGLKTEFDRYYGVDLDFEMYKTGGKVYGIISDTAGNLIVKMNGGRGNPRILKYTHDGRYIQTIVPYPTYHSEDKLRGFLRVALPDGKFMPLVYESRHNSVVPELFCGSDANSNPGGMVVTKDGRIVMSNAVTAGSYYLKSANFRRFLIINDDGTCPRDNIYGATIYPKGANGELHTAVSPDDKLIYLSGLRYQAGASTTPYTYYHAIYRSPIESNGLMQVFIGDSGVAGNDSTHLNYPRGIAVDATGRIYVADKGNNRVAVFDSTGLFLSQFSVRTPEKIAVNNSTGEIFVVSLSTTTFSINKYSSFPAMDSLYSRISTWDGDEEPLFCLNYRVSPVKIYYNNIHRNDHKVYTLEDNGSALTVSSLVLNQGKTGILSRGSGYDYHESPGRITIDTGETIIMAGSKDNWVKINIATGEIKASTVKANDMVFGEDGYLYTYGGKQFSTYKDSLMRRFIVDWTSEAQTPFAGGATEFKTVDNSFMGPNTLCGGLYVDKNGKMYVSSYKEDQRLCVYNPDGTMATQDLVHADGRTIFGGIQLDKNGNIFTMIHSKPKGLIYPDSTLFTGPFFPNPLTSGSAWAYGPYHNHYAWNIGSVVRFPSTGGSFVKQTATITAMRAMPNEDLSSDTIPKVQTNGLFASFVWNVDGVDKQYYGISPSASVSGGHDKCLCISGRLGIDGFGRIYAPDALRFNVVMLDNNLNELGRFGEYGNPDMGPGTANPEPAIPLGMPQFVMAKNNHLYVSDLNNHRIMRLKLTYQTLYDGETILSSDAINALVMPASLSVYPEPFNPVVSLSLSLPTKGTVKISLHSANGTLVRTLVSQASVAAGKHSYIWNGTDNEGRAAASGVYVARVAANNKVITQKLTLVR
jgi:hypothetical protein